MKLTKFHTVVAIGSLLAAGSAFAQAQKGGEAETKSPSQSATPKAGGEQGKSSQGQSAQPSQQGQREGKSAQRGSEAGSKSEPKRQNGTDNGQGSKSARGSNSNDGKANRAETDTKSKTRDKSQQSDTNNRKDTRTEEQRKAANKDGSRNGRADGKSRDTATGKSADGVQQNRQADRNQQNQPNQQADRNRAAGDQNANRPGGTERVQLSEQQRTQAKQTILRSSNVNRARQASFSINIGTRVPRTVRLAVIPAAVISLVPQYRSYRYVVVDDRICIVEPNSYTIVEVLDEGSNVPSGGTQEARLVLTPDEENFILDTVEMGESTLGLGAITIGSPAPRNARMVTFSAPVLDRVSKLRSYEFVAADNRVAIVEPRSRNVVYIVERRR